MTVQVPNSLPVSQVSVFVQTSLGNSNTLYFNVTPTPLINIRLMPSSGSAGSTFAILSSKQLGYYNVDGNIITSTSYQPAPDGQGNSTTSRIKIPLTTSLGAKNVVALDPSSGNPVTNNATFTVTQTQSPANVLSWNRISVSPYAGPLPDPGENIAIQTDIDWEYYLAGGNSPPVVNFVNATNSNIRYYNFSSAYPVSYYSHGLIAVSVPIEARNGILTITNSFGTGSGVQLDIAERAYIPCGTNSVTCSNQCVAYGTQPQLLQGRVLADDNDPLYQSYQRYCANRYVSAFAEGREHEWVQWQLSYDGNNWSDISGATTKDYQPSSAYQKTYYRRVSTHLEYHWIGSSREYWYTSEVVTITPGPATPAQAQSYTSCGSFPLTVALNSTPNAISYNWYSVDPAWDVNGQGRFQNNTGASVQITPPTNVAAGTYTFNVVANGECSQSFGTVSIVVDPIFTTPAPTTASFVDVSISKQCYSIYNLRTPVLNGVTSYSATLSTTGQTLAGTISNIAGVPTVTFPFRIVPMPTEYGVSAVINVVGACGTASYTTPDYDLDNTHSNCSGRAASSDVVGIYPNPASDQVILQAGGQEVEVAFYDAQGECRKTVKLKEQNAETAVNLLDLPAGTYHLRIISNGKVVMQKQLIINH